MNKIRIYMAGPLFSAAERRWNEALAQALSNADARIDCVLPQVTADQYLPDLPAVVADCFYQIREAHLVIACLDGSDADSGTAVEVGYAHGRGTPVIGYRTDFRGNEVDGVNAMLRYGCQAYVQVHAADRNSFSDLVARLCAEIEAALPK